MHITPKEHALINEAVARANGTTSYVLNIATATVDLIAASLQARDVKAALEFAAVAMGTFRRHIRHGGEDNPNRFAVIAFLDLFTGMRNRIIRDYCHVCGKHESQPHTSETRKLHSAYMSRHGWSGMCKSPVASHYK